MMFTFILFFSIFLFLGTLVLKFLREIPKTEDIDNFYMLLDTMFLICFTIYYIWYIRAAIWTRI